MLCPIIWFLIRLIFHLLHWFLIFLFFFIILIFVNIFLFFHSIFFFLLRLLFPINRWFELICQWWHFCLCFLLMSLILLFLFDRIKIWLNVFIKFCNLCFINFFRVLSLRFGNWLLFWFLFRLLPYNFIILWYGISFLV